MALGLLLGATCHDCAAEVATGIIDLSRPCTDWSPVDCLTPAAIAGRLTAALVTIRDLWDDMLTESTGAGHGGSSDPRVITVVNLRMEIHWQVRSWVQMVAEDNDAHDDLPHGTDTLGLLDWLRDHVDWVAEHDAALDALQELTDCSIAIENAVYGVARKRLLLGSCTTSACGGEVREAGRNHDGVMMARCQSCGIRESVEWWAKQMQLTMNRTLTTDEVCALAKNQFGKNLTPRGLCAHVRNGKLNPVDADAKPYTFTLAEAVRFLC